MFRFGVCVKQLCFAAKVRNFFRQAIDPVERNPGELPETTEELGKIGTAMDVVFAILGHNANIFSEALELQISAPEGKPAATVSATATETDETPETIPLAKASGEHKKWACVFLSNGCTLLHSWFHFFCAKCLVGCTWE